MTVYTADDKPLNPWVPERDALRVAVLGKLLEELGELTSAAARCLIQGFEECEPVTGKPNDVWLAEEMADVSANLLMAAQFFGLDMEGMGERAEMKHHRLERWHDLIRAETRPIGDG